MYSILFTFFISFDFSKNSQQKFVNYIDIFLIIMSINLMFNDYCDFIMNILIFICIYTYNHRRSVGSNTNKAKTK